MSTNPSIGTRVRRRSVSPDRLADELDLDGMRDDAGLGGAFEKYPDGVATARAVIKSPFVNIHPDEPIGERGIKVAGVIQGVIERLLAMIERVLNAFF